MAMYSMCVFVVLPDSSLMPMPALPHGARTVTERYRFHFGMKLTQEVERARRSSNKLKTVFGWYVSRSDRENMQVIYELSDYIGHLLPPDQMRIRCAVEMAY
jgi:hypothetical protein